METVDIRENHRREISFYLDLKFSHKNVNKGPTNDSDYQSQTQPLLCLLTRLIYSAEHGRTIKSY